MAPATAYWEGVAQRAGRVMVCVGSMKWGRARNIFQPPEASTGCLPGTTSSWGPPIPSTWAGVVIEKLSSGLDLRPIAPSAIHAA